MLGDAVPKGRARRRRQGGARADPVRALKCARRTSQAITHFTTNRCNPSRALQTGRPLHFPNPNFAPIHITRPPKLYSGYAAIKLDEGRHCTFGFQKVINSTLKNAGVCPLLSSSWNTCAMGLHIVTRRPQRPRKKGPQKASAAATPVSSRPYWFQVIISVIGS